MKNTDKVTMTVGQLKKLVKESHYDYSGDGEWFDDEDELQNLPNPKNIKDLANELEKVIYEYIRQLPKNLIKPSNELKALANKIVNDDIIPLVLNKYKIEKWII
mgnify:CR=1 FL=1